MLMGCCDDDDAVDADAGALMVFCNDDDAADADGVLMGYDESGVWGRRLQNICPAAPVLSGGKQWWWIWCSSSSSSWSSSQLLWRLQWHMAVWRSWLIRQLNICQGQKNRDGDYDLWWKLCWWRQQWWFCCIWDLCTITYHVGTLFVFSGPTVRPTRIAKHRRTMP